MRRLFTVQEAKARGLSAAALRWGEQTGRWRQVERGVYGQGPADPTPLDRALAVVLVTGGVPSGHLAGVLHRLDSVELRGPDVSVPPGHSGRRRGTRRRHLPPERITTVGGVPCASGLQTLLDLAATLDDLRWEQALESALRKRLVTIDELEHAPDRVRGRPRVRRVLQLRPNAAPPTESLLETLAVQLARTVSGLPEPVRQYDVYDANGAFVARVDLVWPELGLFTELDGEHHKGQPVYDARRQTAVVAAAGWLCARFTWTEIVHFPVSTARRLAALAEQARLRPVAGL